MTRKSSQQTFPATELAMRAVLFVQAHHFRNKHACVQALRERFSVSRATAYRFADLACDALGWPELPYATKGGGVRVWSERDRRVHGEAMRARWRDPAFRRKFERAMAARKARKFSTGNPQSCSLADPVK